LNLYFENRLKDYFFNFLIPIEFTLYQAVNFFKNMAKLCQTKIHVDRGAQVSTFNKGIKKISQTRMSRLDFSYFRSAGELKRENPYFAA
jgi:hypothetical protein